MVPALGAIAALTVLGMYLVAVEASARRDVAFVAAGIATITPLLLIQSAVFLSYGFAFCTGLFAVWALLRGARTGSAGTLAAGGVLLGDVLLTRTFDAVLWGIPFVGRGSTSARSRCSTRRSTALSCTSMSSSAVRRSRPARPRR